MEAARPEPTEVTLTPGEVVVLSVACVAALTAVVMYWLPFATFNGVASTLVDARGGGGQFVAAVALPIAMLAIALLAIRRRPRPAHLACLSAATMATLAPGNQVALALWGHDNPGNRLLGGWVEFRGGFYVAVVVVLLGTVLLAAVVGTLAFDTPGPETAESMSGFVAVVVALGLLVAASGQIWLTDSAHLWSLPGWLQAGRWWQLAVTTTLCALAVWRRSTPALAAAVPAAVVGLATAWQQLNHPDAADLLITSMRITVIGYAVVVLALAVAVTLLLRRRVGTTRVAVPAG